MTSTTMKAWIHTEYGPPDVLKMRNVDKPTPGDNQVLVRMKACSLNPFDWHVLRGDPRLFRPMLGGLRGHRRGSIPGADISGIVESIGSSVTRFSVGDEVYGEPLRGGFAEYVAVKESALSAKPRGLSFEEAAGVPMAGLTALQGLRDQARLQEGQSVLINGAGGGIGVFAIQIAKAFGAAKIVAVCGPAKAELVRSLGATKVVDYTTEDFTLLGERYDVVFDLVVNQSVKALRRVLAPRGILILCGGGKPGTLIGPVPTILRGMLLGAFSRHRVSSFVAKTESTDLERINALVEDGRLKVIVGTTFPFTKAPDALRLLEEGHATGKIVVSM